ncbi:PLD nuclease N-terminal domain-containing protein [Kribbella lupini]|uniref:Cardiolipin synthase N-terminal domain-containing protein n=1 Tax=Kribbella lupini TaxID=291602 RepID=A0ABN2ASG0_9ACTN
MNSLALSNDTLGTLGGAGIIAILAAYALLVLGALVSSLTAPQSGGMKLVWLVFIIVAPFIGSLLWFLFGKRSTYA